MGGEYSHIPVLLEECIEGLKIKPDGHYLDATLGGAGHSIEIAKRLKGGTLYCLDRDPDAIAVASKRLENFGCVKIIQSDFSSVSEALEGIKLDGALFDLGVSSFQLDSAQRGFSYHSDAPLDMRMSKSGMSARDVVNSYSISELCAVLRDYGETPFAYEIAKKIVKARETAPIETTSELAELCISALPPKERRKDKHPARTVFQAIRMEVNDELQEINEGLGGAFELLNSGGRLCVISFHSVEDRAVKHKYRELVGGCTCPKDFPVCVCGNTTRAILVNKKPIEARESEALENRRARSAKLRIIEKI